MAKAKTPRTIKPKAEKKVLQMPDNSNGRNGYSVSDLESEIRLRAYELYERRGCFPGQEEQDWFAAEREVLARRADQSHTA
jgi:hypothetical protein